MAQRRLGEASALLSAFLVIIMADWLLIVVALVLAFLGAAFLAERLCRKLVKQARQRRAGISFNPLDGSDDEDDRTRD